MKTTNELHSSAGRAGAVLVLLSSLMLTSQSSAKGKPGGGGGGTNPPPSAPINYAVTWLTPADSPDESRLWDVDTNGVAVGQIRPNGSEEDRYGIVSFPGRAPVDLEALVQAGTHQGDQLPAGWKLNAVATISDNLLVGGDLVPAEGSAYIYGAFAAQLTDDGTNVSVDWFEIFPAPPGTESVYLEDASENGDCFVVEVTSAQFPNQIHHWSPRSAPDTPQLVSELPAFLWALSVNNSGQICWTTSAGTEHVIYVDDPLEAAPIVVGESSRGSYYMGRDIAEDGSVVGAFRTSKRGAANPGIWIPDAGWQQIASASTSGIAYAVNSATQAFGIVDGDFFIFSPSDGAFRLDDVIVSGGDSDNLDRWLSGGSYSEWLRDPHCMSDPDATGYGWIVGYVNVGGGGGPGRAFILRPISAEP